MDFFFFRNLPCEHKAVHSQIQADVCTSQTKQDSGSKNDHTTELKLVLFINTAEAILFFLLLSTRCLGDTRLLDRDKEPVRRWAAAQAFTFAMETVAAVTPALVITDRLKLV